MDVTLPVLTGEKVLLRPIRMDDTNLIVTWRNNPEVKRNFIFREVFTPEMHRHWMETKVASGEVIQYIIENRADKQPIGSVYYRDINQEYASAEYGIFIGADAARGKGLGTEAAKIFLEFGRSALHLHRISLRVLKENRSAIESYKKAGFVEEGIFRDMVKLDGQYHDVVFMAVIEE